MEVFAEGFRPREVQFAIVEQNPTLLNVTLQRDVSRRKDIEGVAPSKINTKAATSGKDSDKKKPVLTSQEFDEDLDDEVDKKDDGDEKEEPASTGLFGLPNPFAKIQTNVKSLLNKIPIIG
jgi:hypothetical protein